MKTNKYYFLCTDLFSTLRIFVFSTLIITSVLVVAKSNLWYAAIITTSILIVKLLWDFGYVSVDSSNKQIIVRKPFRKISITNIAPYEYWWNYEFLVGSIEGESDSNERWKSTSNKVIVNLVLKNKNTSIAFNETIMLDTRHPNDAIYLEKSCEKNAHTVSIQRVDKLMKFLERHYPVDQFKIDDNYIQ